MTGAKRGADTREALLDAALEAMSERGFHGTSVPELTERAGVGAATMYRHFESKAELANALYLHAKRRFATLLLADFPDELPIRKQFRELWERLATIVERHPSLVVFLEMHHHASYLTAETLAAVEDVAMKPLEAIVRRGQVEGIIRSEDPRLLLTFLSGAFLGLAKAVITPGGRIDLTLLRRAESIAWAAVRA